MTKRYDTPVGDIIVNSCGVSQSIVTPVMVQCVETSKKTGARFMRLSYCSVWVTPGIDGWYLRFSA
jgi:hypothetical protein